MKAIFLIDSEDTMFLIKPELIDDSNITEIRTVLDTLGLHWHVINQAKRELNDWIIVSKNNYAIINKHSFNILFKINDLQVKDAIKQEHKRLDRFSISSDLSCFSSLILICALILSLVFKEPVETNIILIICSWAQLYIYETNKIKSEKSKKKMLYIQYLLTNLRN
jgi:hypothetical protein